MQKRIVKQIMENDYQIIKKQLNKKDDCFSIKELETLIQFLTKRKRRK